MELTEVARFEDVVNPLDMIEAILAEQDWSYERPADDELNVRCRATGAIISLSFSWHEALEAMHLACTFDVKVPRDRQRRDHQAFGTDQ